MVFVIFVFLIITSYSNRKLREIFGKNLCSPQVVPITGTIKQYGTQDNIFVDYRMQFYDLYSLRTIHRQKNHQMTILFLYLVSVLLSTFVPFHHRDIQESFNLRIFQPFYASPSSLNSHLTCTTLRNSVEHPQTYFRTEV